MNFNKLIYMSIDECYEITGQINGLVQNCRFLLLYFSEYFSTWGIETLKLKTYCNTFKIHPGARPTSNIAQFRNLQCSGLKCAQLIKTKFSTRQDSVTVVTCAKFHCDRLNILWTRALQSFIEFRIWLKYHYWNDYLIWSWGPSQYKDVLPV